MNWDATIPLNEYTERAEFSIKQGNEFPFDTPTSWWDEEDSVPPPAKDWAHSAARGILADLSDRRGIKQELNSCDDDVKVEITNMLAEIIREAKKQWESDEIEKKTRAAKIAVDWDKVEESYADGFETGKTWVRDYIPGGPWKYGAGEYESDQTKAMAMQTQAEYYAWHQGFVDSGAVEKVNSRRGK